MQIDFSELEELLSPLTAMCKKEKTIDLGGVSVTLRPLTPTEETEVQKMLPDINNEAYAAVEFADVFRKETLSRAIVQINAMDLRGVKLVSTGQTLPSGVEQKITKEEAILKILSQWSRPVLSKVFEEFTFLNEEIEAEMDSSLKLNTEDTDAISENLKERSEKIKQADTLASVSEKSSNESNEVL